MLTEGKFSSNYSRLLRKPAQLLMVLIIFWVDLSNGLAGVIANNFARSIR